jgi:hypothetical protein
MPSSAKDRNIVTIVIAVINKILLMVCFDFLISIKIRSLLNLQCEFT